MPCIQPSLSCSLSTSPKSLNPKWISLCAQHWPWESCPQWRKAHRVTPDPGELTTLSLCSPRELIPSSLNLRHTPFYLHCQLMGFLKFHLRNRNNWNKDVTYFFYHNIQWNCFHRPYIIPETTPYFYLKLYPPTNSFPFYPLKFLSSILPFFFCAPLISPFYWIITIIMIIIIIILY